MKKNLALPAQCALLICLAFGCSDGSKSSGVITAGTAAPPPAGAGAAGAAGSSVTTAGTSAVETAGTGTATAGTSASTAGTGSTVTAGTGAAGSPGTDPGQVGAAGTAAPTAGTGATMPDMGTKYPDPRGKCTIDSGYADDRACLLPPPAGEGMQIHVGPTDYKNAAEVAKYIMRPGEESSQCWTFRTPNDQPVYYQTYELSGRAGTHHIINTMYNQQIADGGFTGCADPGTGTNGNIIDNLPGASKAYMARGIVAPENMDVGRMIPPKAVSQADMHYFNFTDKDIIREFWMNVYFVKPEVVKQQAEQIRAMGGISWSFVPIAPGTDMVYKYECPIVGNGRIMSLLGHYHAHGKQFTASIRRADSGKTEKVFEMFDYLDPAQFDYDTVQKNPAFTPAAAGALSGLLEVKNGDVLMWDCHIINDGDVGLTYTNEVKTGEMCNLWGSSLGISAVNCVLP